MNYLASDHTGFIISYLRRQLRSRAIVRQRQLGASRASLGSDGFTIVELMIATLVFSIIMLVITFGVLDFTAAYYKGVNSSTTQNAARSISDAITQDIQVSGGANGVTTTTGSVPDHFCAGGDEYTFAAGRKYNGGAATSSRPGVYVHPQTSGCNALTLAQYSDGHGRQLLPTNMRVAYLSVSSGYSSTYMVNVRLAYGDADLLCDPNAANTDNNSCQYNGANPLLPTSSLTPAANLQCRLQTGAQFCAVSGLAVTVLPRVSN